MGLNVASYPQTAIGDQQEDGKRRSAVSTSTVNTGLGTEATGGFGAS
jgi:hypothetical protein